MSCRSCQNNEANRMKPQVTVNRGATAQTINFAKPSRTEGIGVVRREPPQAVRPRELIFGMRANGQSQN